MKALLSKFFVKKYLILLTIVLSFSLTVAAVCYSPYYTHPDLTAQMAVLYNQKNSGVQVSSAEIAWLRQGAIEEDEPPRWINHFYDPVHGVGWGGKHAGDIDEKSALAEGTDMAPLQPLPSIYWSTNQEAQAVYRQFGNQTWQKAIWSYLTGDKESAFKALGHILHLVEDASVPDHTRNDTHTHLHGDPGSPFETYAESFTNTNRLNIGFTLSNQNLPVYGSIYDVFFDVAKYSNSHFFSEDTINNSEFLNPNLANVLKVGEYLYDKNSDIYLAKYVNFRLDSLYTTNDSDYVLPSYKDHLFPKVILSGAGVIKLFFEEVNRYAQKPETLEPLVPNQPLSWLETLLNSPGGAIKQPGVAFYQNVLTNIGLGQQATNQLDSTANSILNVPIPPNSYSPALFEPSTGTLSLLPESKKINLQVNALDNNLLAADFNQIDYPEVTSTALIGSVDVSTDQEKDALLYSQAPVNISGDLSDSEKNYIRSAIANIPIDSSPANAAGVALALGAALAALGYTVKARLVNGQSVFDIIKQVPRTVYDAVTTKTEVLAPTVHQEIEYMDVPVTQIFSKPVQIVKDVIETSYAWVQEAVPVVRQVAKTVYDYVVSLVPETMRNFIGGVWQSITNLVSKIVPVVKTVYQTIVDTVYRWVKKPVEYIKTITQTVWQNITQTVIQKIPVIKDIVEYDTKTVSNTTAQARTVYDSIAVGSISTSILPSEAVMKAPAEVVPPVAKPLPEVPPYLYLWIGYDGPNMIKSYVMLVDGVWHPVSDPSSIEKIYGNILDKIPNAAGLTDRFSTSGGSQTFLKSWQMLSDVFRDGTLPYTPEAYARGEPGTGHPVGWAWQPVEMIDPRTNIIYSVDLAAVSDFETQLGWQRTDSGLFTTAELNEALRSGEGYDLVKNFRKQLAYTTDTSKLALPSAGVGEPTPFQIYFNAQIAAGKNAADILANNPYMEGGTAYVSPISGEQMTSYKLFDIPFKPSLSGSQMRSVQNMLAVRANQGFNLNQTDAQNFAFAIGAANWQQFVGSTPAQALALSTPQQIWSVAVN